MTPRWYAADDDAKVRALYAVCHPGWPERPPHWFHAHPTLVLDDVAGMTSFTLSPMPDGLFAYLLDTCVHPDAQGKGYGALLFRERERIVKDLGAIFLVGVTAPTNHTMRHMLAAAGFTQGEHVPHAYADGPADVWTRRI